MKACWVEGLAYLVVGDCVVVLLGVVIFIVVFVFETFNLSVYFGFRVFKFGIMLRSVVRYFEVYASKYMHTDCSTIRVTGQLAN